MAETSTIEWTDATWNPITGCSVVSPGCTNCYAMKLAGGRLRNHPSRARLTSPSKAGPVWNGRVRLNKDWLDQPLRWRRPRRIFVCAHGDLFHESVPAAWIDRVFAVMALAPHHQFQVLTKRPERMRAWFARRSGQYSNGAQLSVYRTLAGRGSMKPPDGLGGTSAGVAARMRELIEPSGWPLPNVWLGVSAEDQARADERIPALLETPAAVRFLSAEPLLGPIDLRTIDVSGWDETAPLGWSWLDRCEAMKGGDEPRVDWVIVGGESGQGARPMHPDWARSLRDQCQAASVPFFFKQWGAWIGVEDLRRLPGGQGPGFGAFDHLPHDMETDAVRVGKAAAGRTLDGRTWDQMPGAAT